MRIVCPNCHKAYQIKDDKLPSTSRFSVKCLACKKPITIDMRSKVEQDKPIQSSNPEKKKQPYKYSRSISSAKKQPTGMTLKYGILRSLDDLPAMPHVVYKAQEIMRRPDSNIKELAKVIEIEQAIATRVLKLANSSYYGLSRKVSSIHHASVLLGYKTLQELIAVAGISNLMNKNFKGYGLSSEDVWRHSIAVAFGSRIIANRKDVEFGDSAFFAGLIHDAGKLILDQYVYERKDTFNTFMADGRQTFLYAEKEILGFDHSEIASELCLKWKIPDEQRVAIRFHHCPSQSKACELAYILHMADCIAMMNGCGVGTDSLLYQPEKGAMEFLGLQDDEIARIKDEVLESVEKIAGQMNP